MKKLLTLTLIVYLGYSFSCIGCGFLGTDYDGCDIYFCPAEDPTDSCVVIQCDATVEVNCAS